MERAHPGPPGRTGPDDGSSVVSRRGASVSADPWGACMYVFKVFRDHSEETGDTLSSLIWSVRDAGSVE